MLFSAAMMLMSACMADVSTESLEGDVAEDVGVSQAALVRNWRYYYDRCIAVEGMTDGRCREYASWHCPIL